MEVTILVSPEAAQALRENKPNSETAQMQALAATAGGRLQPLHNDSDDPQLTRYFHVQARDGEHAEQLARSLRSLAATEAAYVKPPGEAP